MKKYENIVNFFVVEKNINPEVGSSEAKRPGTDKTKPVSTVH